MTNVIKSFFDTPLNKAASKLDHLSTTAAPGQDDKKIIEEITSTLLKEGHAYLSGNKSNKVQLFNLINKLVSAQKNGQLIFSQTTQCSKSYKDLTIETLFIRVAEEIGHENFEQIDGQHRIRPGSEMQALIALRIYDAARHSLIHSQNDNQLAIIDAKAAALLVAMDDLEKAFFNCGPIIHTHILQNDNLSNKLLNSFLTKGDYLNALAVIQERSEVLGKGLTEVVQNISILQSVYQDVQSLITNQSPLTDQTYHIIKYCLPTLCKIASIIVDSYSQYENQILLTSIEIKQLIDIVTQADLPLTTDVEDFILSFDDQILSQVFADISTKQFKKIMSSSKILEHFRELLTNNMAFFTDFAADKKKNSIDRNLELIREIFFVMSKKDPSEIKDLLGVVRLGKFLNSLLIPPMIIKPDNFNAILESFITNMTDRECTLLIKDNNNSLLRNYILEMSVSSGTRSDGILSLIKGKNHIKVINQLFESLKSYDGYHFYKAKDLPRCAQLIYNLYINNLIQNESTLTEDELKNLYKNLYESFYLTQSVADDIALERWVIPMVELFTSSDLDKDVEFSKRVLLENISSIYQELDTANSDAKKCEILKKLLKLSKTYEEFFNEDSDNYLLQAQIFFKLLELKPDLFQGNPGLSQVNFDYLNIDPRTSALHSSFFELNTSNLSNKKELLFNVLDSLNKAFTNCEEGSKSEKIIANAFIEAVTKNKKLTTSIEKDNPNILENFEIYKEIAKTTTRIQKRSSEQILKLEQKIEKFIIKF